MLVLVNISLFVNIINLRYLSTFLGILLVLFCRYFAKSKDLFILLFLIINISFSKKAYF
ncbi:hypothetical protein HMPREF1860_01309 [Prevotella amnii]|uniref:Uncharacterized protein n=1 Tax=Prevotella amnii TaxID=419005 RepID=A0A134BCD9_9BACT|nr:hypothetical protein HMPREF1860_01309 [Prevotella amnii]